MTKLLWTAVYSGQECDFEKYKLEVWYVPGHLLWSLRDNDKNLCLASGSPDSFESGREAAESALAEELKRYLPTMKILGVID